MTTISPVSSAYNQNVAFRANEETQKPKRHPIKAVLLFPFPGVGEISNGDKKNGLKHAGIDLAMTVSLGLLAIYKVLPVVMNNIDEAKKIDLGKGMSNKEFFKTVFKGISKKTIAGLSVVTAIGTANVINAAIKTYKGKQPG